MIIENQLERTDHNHLGQLLTYAGGLDAAVVVWISPEVRDEHRKALDWLNRHTDDEIDFFGVVVEAIRIDESKPAVQFRPVAVPNEFGKRPPAAATSERGLIYKAFFQGVIDELRERYRFTNARIAQPQSWYSFASGVSGFSYGLTFTASRRLQAEVYINTGDTQRNKAVFEWFNRQKESIEAEMGEVLIWEPLEHRQASRICVARPDTTFAAAAENPEELTKWSVERLLRLKQVFGPRLKLALDDTAASPPTELT